MTYCVLQVTVVFTVNGHQNARAKDNLVLLFSSIAIVVAVNQLISAGISAKDYLGEDRRTEFPLASGQAEIHQPGGQQRRKPA